MINRSASVPGPSDVGSSANAQRFYHGTRADLKPGDLIGPGYTSNYGKRKKANYVYLTGTIDAAVWGRSWHSAKTPAEST